MELAQSKKNNLALIVVGLLLGVLMAAMDNTIVATAMGTIVSDLGGLDKFVWVTSAYMIAEMAGMPVFGKLSDMYGRKRFFIFGLIVFLAGSLLCSTADSIVELSLFRAVQGIGGGALVPIAFTIIFDVFPVEKRGSMGGLFGAVFGLSSIFGPLLGAYITDYLTWHWVFYINVPLGLIALGLIVFCYRESHEHSRQRIDWQGAVTLVGSVLCLMFALELGGTTFAWNSAPILGLFAAFVVLLAVFLYTEARAEEPILSFAMFRQRLYAASNLVGMFSGAAFIVAAVYIPIFVQGVQGGTATNSGLVLLPMMLGSVVSAQIGGNLSAKIGYRNVMIVFSFILAVGIVLLGSLSADTSRLAVTMYMIVVGLGIGASFSVLGMAAIHHFDTRQRGSANATIAFLRELGMTVGIIVFGVIQRHVLTSQLDGAFSGDTEGAAVEALSEGAGAVGAAAGAVGAAAPAAGTSATDLVETGASAGHVADDASGVGAVPGALPPAFDLSDPHAILSPHTRALIPTPLLDKITAALSTSIAHTFLWAIVPAGLALLSVFLMSGERLIVHKGSRAAEAERMGEPT
jgi:EmrB/QacA subfamily drug resistance transporter